MIDVKTPGPGPGSSEAAAAPHPPQAPARQAAPAPPLSADDLRHPLDKQNTALLRALPGLELLARNLLGPAAEQVLLLENIATAVRVGHDQLPSLHASLLDAALALQMGERAPGPCPL